MRHPAAQLADAAGARRAADVDYGFGVEVGKRGSGSYVCAGDTVLDPSAASSLRRADHRQAHALREQAEGRPLRQPKNGHGFFISRSDVRLF